MPESKYILSGCTVADGPGLAINNMSAWWEDPTWNMLWHVRPLRYVINGAAARIPHNLLRDRDHLRHQKVTDAETGKIVGYARWELPEGCGGEWLLAQTPDVSEEDRERYGKMHSEADLQTHEGLGEMDDPVHAIRPGLMEGRKYLVLDYLAVNPEAKGRGIATLLVNSGLEVAKEHGWDVFVLANTPGGKGVYQKAGFVILEQVIQDMKRWHGTHNYELYFMEKKFSDRGVEESGP